MIRKDIKTRLKTLTQQYVEEQSGIIANKLESMPSFQSSECFSIYLAMSGEVATKNILETGFATGKRIFIPKITGKNSKDIFKLEVNSMEMIESFPKNNWGIPEPTLEMMEATEDGVHAGVIDLIILPGVAFDRTGGRIGHGRGYYDCLVERITLANQEKGRSPPLLVGLALDEQIVDKVPMEEHDRVLDAIVTPSAIYSTF